MRICKLQSPKEPYSGIRQKELQCYLLLAKLALSHHHRHEYVSREVEHGVQMISQKAQFCLCLILICLEASRNKFLVHTLPICICLVLYH